MDLRTSRGPCPNSRAKSWRGNPRHAVKIHLVGGFNPFEKYSSKWESSPNRVENKKYLKPPSRWFEFGLTIFTKHLQWSSGVWPLSFATLAPDVNLLRGVWEKLDPLAWWCLPGKVPKRWWLAPCAIFCWESHPWTLKNDIENSIKLSTSQQLFEITKLPEKKQMPDLGSSKIILQISSSSLAAAICRAVEPIPFL